MDITNWPVVWANYVSIAGFIFLGVLVWLIPKRLIFSGAKSNARWRDVRWWASALILLQLVIYATFAPPAAAETRLYIFDCGTLYLDDVSAFGLSNEETDARVMSVPCYMVEHGGKRLLWDGGLPLSLVGDSRQTLPTGLQTFYPRSLLDQLAMLNLQPEDFDYIAFSHFHFDHIGAANAFADAHLLIQEAEYQAAFVDHEKYPVFDASLYAALTDSPRTLLQGDHDVFGDGVVTLVSAPGHTPGHQVLLVRLPEYGPVLLSGDLYHFSETRSLRRTPVFNTDAEETLRSMDKVEALIAATGATLWIEHVKAQTDALKAAPDYYR